MAELLRGAYPHFASKIFVETNCDGMPLCPQDLASHLTEGGYFGH